MTNCYVRNHLLQKTENAHFFSVQNRIRSIFDSEAEKRRTIQQRNSARRRQRMIGSNYRSMPDDSDSD